MIQFYKLFENFSIYCHCYPFISNNEVFHVGQYYEFRDKLNKIMGSKLDKLKHFNYFDHRLHDDGTLLHQSIKRKYQSSVEILLKDGFDINVKNKQEAHLEGKERTTFEIAKKENNGAIL